MEIITNNSPLMDRPQVFYLFICLQISYLNNLPHCPLNSFIEFGIYHQEDVCTLNNSWLYYTYIPTRPFNIRSQHDMTPILYVWYDRCGICVIVVASITKQTQRLRSYLTITFDVLFDNIIPIGKYRNDIVW